MYDIMACVMPSNQISSGFLKYGFGSHETFMVDELKEAIAAKL